MDESVYIARLEAAAHALRTRQDDYCKGDWRMPHDDGGYCYCGLALIWEASGGGWHGYDPWDYETQGAPGDRTTGETDVDKVFNEDCRKSRQRMTPNRNGHVN